VTSRLLFRALPALRRSSAPAQPSAPFVTNAPQVRRQPAPWPRAATAGSDGGAPAADGGGNEEEGGDLTLTVSVLASIDGVGREEWNALALAADGGDANPFLRWEYLKALEASGSAARFSACDARPAPPRRR